MNVISGLKDIFSLFQSPRPQLPFTVLFKKFRNILERNNRILELMADMGDKLGGEYVFDRQYILESCEGLNDHVFKMISDLCVLNQRKNVDLFIAFERIQHEIQEELAGRHAFPAVRPAVLLNDVGIDTNDEMGNKFAALGGIRNVLGLPTPDGFVITTRAFFAFMEYNKLQKQIEAALSAWQDKDETRFDRLSADIRERVLGGRMPRFITSHVTAMMDILEQKNPHAPMVFAVRSSAWGEDSEYSFAGQYESALNVPQNAVLDAYRQVVASAYTPEAWHYRLHRGYREHEMAMAVGCQLMVEAEVSGAMYTYAPLSADSERMVISAAWGLGPAVVQGIAESDTIILDRSPPNKVLSVDVGHKTSRLTAQPSGGIGWEEIPEDLRDTPCLTPGQISQLAQAALVIERFYKRPQDIEWAFDRSGTLSILQSRPLNVRSRNAENVVRIDDATRTGDVIFSGKGMVVQRGVATARAFVAGSEEDLSEFPYGAILVTRYTSPKYSRLMAKASGIITDVGSATGHMATLAREYRIPTLVDTGDATKLLKTGEEITLDATQNIVYRGAIRELSHFELTEEDVFEDSYEYRLLRRLLKKVSPLNLVDPLGDNFKASRCRTFHDITRYIHETAVEKLIALSEDYENHHNTTPKRLEWEIPLGLTIIDIENGTSALPGEQVLTVKDIESVPMKALLQGLSESGMWGTGPVAVDLGSFMSSFTRTFSSSLASPEKVGRNLAVISKQYMNLHLRLGYHFNIVDAYIGDTLNDNYVYFRFLGGVTDFIRRSRRARLIAEVLERYDFRVEVHGDLVVGRLKKISSARMIGRMKVLGGLIGYTRQLDVSMSNEGEVLRHFADFTRRIETLTEV